MITIQPKFYDERSAGRLTLVVSDMPALKGSDKQVSWASDIRSKKQVDFAEQLAKAIGVAWGCVTQRDVDYIAQCQVKLDAFTSDPAHAPSFEKLAVAFAIADARFWIDNRGDDMNLLARSAAAYLKSA